MGVCIKCGEERSYIRKQHCLGCRQPKPRGDRPVEFVGAFAELREVAAITPLVERVLCRTTPAQGGCIAYTGHTRDGYGAVESRGREHRVHRLVYEALAGPIPEGLVLDHVCHTRDLTCPGGRDCQHRRCVNPNHLEPVTNAENDRRGRSRVPLRTHCSKGHEFTAENTGFSTSHGRPYRYCRTCLRNRDAAKWKSRKASP